MVTPQTTLPSIIFFGVESPPLSKIIVLASFFSAYSTIPVTIDARVTMTSDLKSRHLTFGLSLILVRMLSNSDLIIQDRVNGAGHLINSLF